MINSSTRHHNLFMRRQPDGSISQLTASHRLFKDVPQGAATTIWCTTSPQFDGMGGVYCEDCDIAEGWFDPAVPIQNVAGTVSHL